jgi:hypothetical protein
VAKKKKKRFKKNFFKFFFSNYYYIEKSIFILLPQALLVIFPIILNLVAMCGSYRVRNWTRWSSDAKAFCLGTLALIIFVFVPLLAFEILLAQNADGTKKKKKKIKIYIIFFFFFSIIGTVIRSYPIIFIPLFILEGCGCIGCILLNIAAMMD